LFRDESAYSWTKLLELTLGSLYGPSDDVPSFSAVIQVAKDQFFVAKGCKMNSLEIDASKVGSQIYANVDVLSMLIPPAEGVRAELGALGIVAPKPATPPLTYTKYPECTIPGVTAIPASSWNLKISNSLERKEGIVNGKALTAGVGSVPGEPIGIEFTMDVLSTSSFWDNLKLNLTRGFNTTVYVHNHRIELLDCYLPSNDIPPRSHQPYNETITVKAETFYICLNIIYDTPLYT
jgi:hypothetical protein